MRGHGSRSNSPRTCGQPPKADAVTPCIHSRPKIYQITVWNSVPVFIVTAPLYVCLYALILTGGVRGTEDREPSIVMLPLPVCSIIPLLPVKVMLFPIFTLFTFPVSERVILGAAYRVLKSKRCRCTKFRVRVYRYGTRIDLRRSCY